MSDNVARKRRHAVVKALGLWPWYGRLSLAFYAWARREICPMHPDAPMVGHRYSQLKQEFSS